MAASTTEPTTTDEPAPENYRHLDTPGDRPDRWVHRETGLAVDLMRYARHRTAADVMPDHFQYKLVIRPNGPNGSGRAVASATDGDSAQVMATNWMVEHPEGVWDGGEA